MVDRGELERTVRRNGTTAPVTGASSSEGTEFVPKANDRGALRRIEGLGHIKFEIGSMPALERGPSASVTAFLRRYRGTPYTLPALDGDRSERGRTVPGEQPLLRARHPIHLAPRPGRPSPLIERVARQNKTRSAADRVPPQQHTDRWPLRTTSGSGSEHSPAVEGERST